MTTFCVFHFAYLLIVITACGQINAAEQDNMRRGKKILSPERELSQNAPLASSNIQNMRHLRGRNNTETWNSPHDTTISPLTGGLVENVEQGKWNSAHDGNEEAENGEWDSQATAASSARTFECVWSEAAKDIVSWINSEREERGLRQLAPSCHLRREALSCSVDSANAIGIKQGLRVTAPRNCCDECLKNVAIIQEGSSAYEARTALTSLTEHLDNMLHSEIRYLGVAVYRKKGGHLFITERFE